MFVRFSQPCTVGRRVTVAACPSLSTNCLRLINKEIDRSPDICSPPANSGWPAKPLFVWAPLMRYPNPEIVGWTTPGDMGESPKLNRKKKFGVPNLFCETVSHYPNHKQIRQIIWGERSKSLSLFTSRTINDWAQKAERVSRVREPMSERYFPRACDRGRPLLPSAPFQNN